MALATAVQVTTSCALPGVTPTPVTFSRGGGVVPVGNADASADGGPSATPVRVAITCTVYSVPLARLSIVWLVVDPEVTVYCRSPVL